ncbi:DUF3015 family protein [Acinetobacter sp. B51(2017)]|uniref:DUF3015 family protein n=1 Tax=Acinetobacter sp. B51(2017) TaxID=2060938 RepID=UPI000F07CE93|nr:DUF3015 family protein [Acinetobacter sp. B51(2017)]
MLKKIALGCVLALGSMSAFADGDAGCGIGSQVWAGQSGKIPKLMAATTNGIFLNQLFGITFGTLGCNGNGTVSAKVVTFTHENAENLARDMAVGEGENLNVLAELLQIKTEDKPRFFAVSKANFTQIYASENSLEVLASLQQVMAQDEVLKAYV